MERKMNRKNRIKAGVLAVLVLCICAGCSVGREEKLLPDSAQRNWRKIIPLPYMRVQILLK